MNRKRKLLITMATEDDFLFDSSSSDDDDINELKILKHILKDSRHCIPNYTEVISGYNEREFILHFRLNREKFTALSQEFAESDIYMNLLKQPNSRVNITSEKSVLVFLWFAGHQTSFREVADRFDLCLSSVHAVITRICLFLSSKAKVVIKLSNEAEKRQTSDYYFRSKGFPNIIGSIDGTHIKIDKPSRRHVDYCNRKEYYSINLQGLCNEKLDFIDIFIGFPGSVHDARVFKSSTLYTILENWSNGSYILGDSAYPISPNIMTPYRDNGHLTAAQKHFNKVLASCRVTIENVFGLFKQRFRQMYHLKLRGHKRICHFIRACCVLHNLANKEDMDIFTMEEGYTDSQPDEICYNDHTDDIRRGQGIQLRDEICQEMFLRRNL